jgi:hypothetical protein
MGTGYTRNDTANNIADGNVINASDLDGEFDAVQAAFNGTTGHSHDGTSGEGPQIAAGGIASNAVTTAKILNGNVTTDKIANDAVTGDKLANNIQIAGTLGVTGETTLTTHLNMGDNDIIKLGASADLQIYHDGNNSFIKDAGTGRLSIVTSQLQLTNASDSEVMIKATQDDAVELYYNGSEKLATKSDGVDITGELQTDTLDVDGNADISGTLDMGDNIRFVDAKGAFFGGGNDLQIYHDNGTGKSYIYEQGSGNLVIQGTNIEFDATDGTSLAEFSDGGAVSLRYSGNLKLATKSDGVDITGELQADSLDIDGVADISANLTLGANLNLQDSGKVQFGAGQDLQIYHDGSNSIIKDQGTGNLYIDGSGSINFRSGDGAEYYAVFNDDGKVGLRYNNVEKFATKSDGVDITGELQSDSLDVDGNADISGTLTMGGNVDLQDNDYLLLGASDDLQIYHNGSNSFIDDTGTGDLYIRASDDLFIQKYTGENMIICNVDAQVQLFYDNAQKFATTSTGISVTGDVIGSNGVFGLDTSDYIQHINNSHIRFVVNASEEFRMEADGDFHADANVIAHSTTVSDERLKENIEKIENATDKISQLNGYTFNYKKDGRKGAGVIAQEVEKVLPSAVMEKQLPLKMDDGVAYKIVEYDQIIGLLIESIKELKQEINSLKGE